MATQHTLSGSAAPDDDKRGVSPHSADRSSLQLTEIVNAAADFIATTDPEGCLTFLNPAGRKMAGLSDTDDIRITRLADYHTAPGAELITKTALPEAARTGKWTGETVLWSRNGQEIPIVHTIIAHKDFQGRLLGYSTIGRDVSWRRSAEESMRTAHEALQNQARLLDLAHEAIVVRDLSGTIIYWNQGAARKYGWTKEEAAGKITHQLLQTRFPEPPEEVQRKLLAEGYWEGELVHTRRDGKQMMVASRQVVEKEGRGQGQRVLEINRDITALKETERKLRESELSLRELSGYLLQSQDEERRRISRDLHDSTSQNLTGLLARLHILRRSAEGLGEPAARAAEECLKLAEDTASFIRTLSSGLHPPVLDEQGLAAAIRWYVDGTAAQSVIPIEIESPAELPYLPQRAERSLYRIVQETLTRIRLRATGGTVKIRLASSLQEFVLEIRVAGGKMPAAGARVSPEALLPEMDAGVTGMRERMRQLGGNLEIGPSGLGTLVRAVLPLGRAFADPPRGG